VKIKEYSMSDNYKGVVKWFNNSKGFGFIEHSTGKDVFVHYSVIDSEGFKTLKDGEEVEYEIKEGPKGLHALKVQKCDLSESEGSLNLEAASDESEEENEEVQAESPLLSSLVAGK
jgi:CspA family cold shock protein